MRKITLILLLLGLLNATGAVAQQVKVNLLICDTMGVSIDRASVRFQKPKGAKQPRELRRAISSDQNGQVRLMVAAGDRITIWATGFAPQSITFVADSIKSLYAIIMIPVSAVGDQSARAATTVSERDTRNLGVGNDMLSFLQHATSGASVERTGESYKFYIRGMSSTSGSGSALVLIDGAPGEVGMLNVEDIDTVTVLKDASSTAIYGSRAAFGAVLIKTKRGK